MQTASDLTPEETAAVLKSPAVNYAAGCELLDSSNNLIEDISRDLDPGGSQVERNNYRTIHGTCRLRLARELVWGSQRVRPYMTVTDLVTEVSFRANLGVYLPSTPTLTPGVTPRAYNIDGYDTTVVLDGAYGSTYSASAGDAPLTSVKALLAAAGVTSIVADPTAAATVLDAERLWPIDERTTTRSIVNDLLGAVGYRAVWADWNGSMRLEKYVEPAARAPEFTYDVLASDTIVAGDRAVVADLFDIPNQWTFIQDSPQLGIPGTGTGLYVVDNEHDGPTSQDARERIIPRIVRLSVADQATLEAQGDRIALADRRVAVTRQFMTAPNPLHWHADVFTVVDTDVGPNAKVAGHGWSLPLDGTNMSHETKDVA